MKKPCSNHSKYMYSGKESSPLGLGLAAEPFIVGTIQEGRDKTNWIVTEKNGIRVWSRITRLSEMRDKDIEKKDEVPVVKKKVTRAKKAAKENVNPEQMQNDETKAKAENNIDEQASNSDKDNHIVNADMEAKLIAGKSKRKLSKYNIYMQYKMKQLAKEGTNPKPAGLMRFAVAEWKAMTPEEKEEIVKKAQEAIANDELNVNE